MKLWFIVGKSLRQHALSTVITATSVGLAGALLISVWTVKEQAQTAFAGANAGYDAVLGARGSKLQLVLNAVFHLEESPGNIDWADYEEIRRNPNVSLAVPIAMGDNYRGYRVVGTTGEFFTRAALGNGGTFRVRPPGRIFDMKSQEVVAGSYVAERLKLKRGDLIHPYHGLAFNEEKQHAEEYVVVGLLEPSNTPADRVLWIPMEGLQQMGGHDAKAATQVSAVLVRLKAGSANSGFLLDLKYNKEQTRLTFAWPIGRITAQLFDKIAWFDKVLTLVACIVALASVSSILTSIYNSMNERRREIAILRALGAHQRTVMAAIVFEAVAIAGAGVVLGFVFHFAIMAAVTSILRAQAGVVLNPFAFSPSMVWTPLAILATSALAGAIPAIKGYKTDVARYLGPLS